MTQTRDLIKKMADFFTGEEFYEKGEDARLELSPDDVRCMNEVIKACGNAISRHDEDKIKLVSKQDVINLIDEWNAISFYEANEHSKECYYEMRNAIIAMQPVASCLDAISRQAAINVADYTDYIGLAVEDVKKVTDAVVKGLKCLSPVTPKQRTGHWIKHNTFEKWQCSCCGVQFRFSFKEHYFCPNCGARMEEQS